ncbi:MAG: hypothetical protein IPM63_09830 [Acidobacteriota bacterium]|nr:MAG: hypothetical protein IPM63_09830 [Acidobacteriota bacterium]
MDFTVFDLIGAVGVAIIIATYLLLQSGKMDPRRALYSVFNALGASMILLSLVFDFNLAAFIVEFFWLLISIYGIVRSRFSH